MTITICSGLIVLPQKLIVLQIGEINCLKSQVDCLEPSAGQAGPAFTSSPPLRNTLSSGFCPLGFSGREKLRVRGEGRDPTSFTLRWEEGRTLAER